ncbi:MAG: AAA family ATPase, partial [Chloroflexota bacterium]
MAVEKGNFEANIKQKVGTVESGGQVIGIQNVGLSVDEVKELFQSLNQEENPVWNGEYPYPGLAAFQESDSKFFFGREKLVDRLLERIQASPIVIISGPSGSGKSSVARAGLLHAIREGKIEKSKSWLVATMQPKGDPFEELAISLGAATKSLETRNQIRSDPQNFADVVNLHLDDDPKRRFVLLIDQFEELFTQTTDIETRQAFINLITQAALAKNSRLIVVMTLRSDFVSECIVYPQMRKLLSEQAEFVGAMEPHDLVNAISKPAISVGAKIDPALVVQVIADMKGEPGALPLMNFALRDLFEEEKTTIGEPMDLMLNEYFERGGIEKALERHAETVFELFSEEQKELTKSVFSKLVTVGQGRVDTRRTAAFAELIPAGTTEIETKAVIDELAKAGVRLVTVSAEGGVDEDEQDISVTIAHERLIDAWPWLRQLVDENRELIQMLNQINSDAAQWLATEDDGYLYRGGKLLQVEEQWEVLKPSLSADSVRFCEAAIAQREREIAEREAQLQRELQLERDRANEQALRVRVVRRYLFATLGLLGIAILAGIFAYRQRTQRLADTRLASAENLQLGDLLQSSSLAAIVSVNKDNDAKAEEILRQNISRMPILINKNNTIIENSTLTDIDFSANGNQFAIASTDEGKVYIYNIGEDGATLSKGYETQGASPKAKISPNGNILASIN